MARRLRSLTFVTFLAGFIFSACSGGRNAGTLPATVNGGERVPQVLQEGNGAQFQLLGVLNQAQTSSAGFTICDFGIVSNGLYTFVAMCNTGSAQVASLYRIADNGSIVNITAKLSCLGNPYSPLAVAKDNSLWWPNGHGLCRIAPDGSSSRFFYVPQTAHLFGVGVGPDGNIWFTDLNNTIGKISLTGTVLATYHPLPSNSSLYIQVLTRGPDGNVWFAFHDSTGGYFGKLSPTGTFTKIVLKNGEIVWSYLVNPGDGLLYFVWGGNAPLPSGMGTVSPSGPQNFYFFPARDMSACGPTPGPGCNIGSGLTAGPFGNVWFGISNGIESFSHITHTFGPNITTPYGTQNGTSVLAPGSDGNVWFEGWDSTHPRVAIYLLHSMTVVPTSLTLNTGQSAQVKVSEKYFTGVFLAQSSNTSVATVSPSSSSSGTFTVTGHHARSAMLTISDGANANKNNRVNVAVTVR